MKALVYKEAGQVELEERPKPALSAATDAIVKLKHSTICGTDLHIIKGDVPTAKPGTILGHEGVGVIESLGQSVQGFKAGDTVLISCITACAGCSFCRKGMHSHCVSGGWVLGNTIDGTQAEFVRIPHATTSLYRLPDNANLRHAVLLSDSLPTGLECGIINGRVQPGHLVAIIGSGPVGLSAAITAQLYSPSMVVVVDVDDARLATARQFGVTHTVNSKQPDAVQKLMALTGGQGYDTVVEAVGIPQTFDLCQEIVAPGGVLANAGVHGTKVDLHLERLWDHNISELRYSMP
jgi:alcohol dehydrogenase